MKLLHILLLLLITVNSAAQQVRGIVLSKLPDGKTESLPGASVVWQGTRSGTITDSTGRFVLGIPPGASILIASFTGYNADTLHWTGQEEVQFLLDEGISLGPVEIIKDSESTQLSLIDPLKFQTLSQKELCKAACCNLSESFETNASIDASFTDAITGTRQIRMLGLDGKYTQVMFDNMPGVRGLATTYGLTYVPGPWINTIQIAKGTGSVLSGYESITGQINVAHKNTDSADPLHLNAYAGSGGRLELNLVWFPKLQPVHDHDDEPSSHGHVDWGTILLAHVSTSSLRNDMNEDGFLDNPLFTNVILRNEWNVKTSFGLGSSISASYINLQNVSGKLEYDPQDEIRSQLWGVQLTNERYELNAKVGYVFPEKEWKSIGSQFSLSMFDQSGHYGYRGYSGQQLNARANLLYATRLFGEKNKITTSLTVVHDDYNESVGLFSIPLFDLSTYDLSRLEQTIGVAVEDSWNPSERMTLIAGIRADHHNEFGLLVTPRFHARYSITEKSSIKILAGRGFRTPNLIMDQPGVMAGNRNIVIQGDSSKYLYGLKMEQAWNVGLLFATKFKMRHRDAQLSLDVYRTQFVNQVVVDMEKPGLVSFYNLDGISYSNSAQIEFQWSPMKRCELRLAYRWLDVQTDYTNGILEKPLLNRHRAFANIAYETKAKKSGSQWRFDLTAQWISSKRIPLSGEHAVHNSQTHEYSDPYVILNAQVTYVFIKDLEVYIGGENLTNFMQHDAIVLAEDPSNQYFDASITWGPVFGRMGYAGLRWTLK